MTESTDQTVFDLTQDLRSLDSRRAQAVADAIAKNRSSMPDEVATDFLAAIREALRRSAPPRQLDPKRLFCIPFEDILDNDDPKAKIEGRISRAAISAAWTLVTNRLSPDTMRDLKIDTAHITVRDLSDTESMADRWWPCFADTLGDVVRLLSSDRRFRAETASLLDSPTRPADIREMLDCFEAWEEIKAIRSIVERGTLTLDDRQISTVAQIVVDADKAGRCAARLTDIVIARLGSSELRQRVSAAITQRGLKAAGERAVEYAVQNAVAGIEAVVFAKNAAKHISTVLDMIGRAKSTTVHTDSRIKSLQVRFQALVRDALSTSADLDGDPKKAVRSLDADHDRLKALAAIRNAAFIDNATREIAIDALNRRRDDLETLLDKLRADGGVQSVAYFATMRAIETVWGVQRVDEILVRDGLRPDPQRMPAFSAHTHHSSAARA